LYVVWAAYLLRMLKITASVAAVGHSLILLLWGNSQRQFWWIF
jgi:hypothetical protein